MTDVEQTIVELKFMKRDVLEGSDNDRTLDKAIDALTTLREPEAKEITYFDNRFTGLPVASCPNCSRYACQFYSGIKEETHFCPWCGQAVKWG